MNLDYDFIKERLRLDPIISWIPTPPRFPERKVMPMSDPTTDNRSRKEMFAIQFRFPEGAIVYAGWCADGAAGFAPSVKSAMRFETAEDALRTLRNAYGKSLREHGSVVGGELLLEEDPTNGEAGTASEGTE